MTDRTNPDLPNLDWNDVRPFLALARGGSLSAAARAMGVRHSTISRRMDALEAALGTRLVHRDPSGSRLTDIGQELLPLAVAAEGALHGFASAARQANRPLRLALPTGFARFLMNGLSELYRQNPGILVEVISSNRPANLVTGDADIAVRTAPLRDPDLLVRTAGQIGWSLYAGKGYHARFPVKTDPVDLSGHAILGFHADMAGSEPDRWLAAHSTPGQAVLRLAQMTDLLAAAERDAGVALLPCLLGDASVQVIRLTPQVLVRQPVSLVYRRDIGADPRSSKVIAALIDILKRAAPALIGDSR
jgi:DNA-binding transcriptional LysR family regulator